MTSQLGLGVTIALHDAFSAKARSVSRGFTSMDDIAYQAARGISRSAGKIEAEVFNITRTFAGAFVALGAVVYPTKKAMEFGESLAEVATIADYTHTNMVALRKEILRQSFVYPTSAKEQIESLYQTVSSGFINTKDALTVLESATRLGVTTLTDTPKTLRALTGILNAYSEQFKKAGTTAVEQSDIVSAKLFETTRWGRLRMDELGKYVGYGASASAIGGVNMDDMLASVAGMTLGSLSPEQAFQYYRQLILGTIKPTKQSTGVAEKYGIMMGKEGIEQFGGDWSKWLKHAYDVIAVQNHNLSDFAKLLSGRQAFAGAATLLNQWDKVEGARSSIRNPYVVDKFGAVITSQERAFRIMERKLSYQMKQMEGAWETLFISLGRYSEDFFTPLAKGLNGVLGVVINLVDSSPLLQQAFLGAGLAAAFALGTFGLLQIRLLKQSAAWAELALAARTTKFSLWGMNLTAGAAIRTFAGLFAVVALGAYGIKKAYETNFHGFADTVNKWMTLFSALGGMTREGSNYFMLPEVWEQIEANGWGPLFQTLVRFRYRVETLFYGISAGMRGFFEGLKGVAVSAIDWVANVVGRFSQKHAAQILALKSVFTNFSLSNPEAWAALGRTMGKIAGASVAVVTAWVMWRTLAGGLKASLWLLLTPLRMMVALLRLPGRAMNGAARLKGRMRGVVPGSGLSGVGGALAEAEAGAERMNVRATNVYIRAGRVVMSKGASSRGGARGMGTVLGGKIGSTAKAPYTPKGKVRYHPASQSMRDATGRFVKNSEGGAVAQAQKKVHTFFANTVSSVLVRFLPQAFVSGMGNAVMAIAAFLTGPVGIAVLAAAAVIGLIAYKWDAVTGYMKTNMPTWYSLFSNFGVRVSNVWDGVKKGVERLWTTLTPLFDQGLTYLGERWREGMLFLEVMSGFSFTNIETRFVSMVKRMSASLAGVWADGRRFEDEWKKRHPYLAEAGHAVTQGAEWLNNPLGGLFKRNGAAKQGGSEMDARRSLQDKYIDLLPAAPKWSTDPKLRKEYAAGNEYRGAFGHGYGSTTGLAQFQFLKQNSIHAPLDPGAPLDLGRLTRPQLTDLQDSLRAFLDPNSKDKNEIQSRMPGGVTFISKLQSTLASVTSTLEGSGKALPIPGDTDALYNQLTDGSTGIAAQTAKGARDGILDAERLRKGPGVYETPEYMALWKQQVENPFKEFYAAMSYSDTLVKGKEQGSGAYGNNVQQIATEVAALAGLVHDVVKKTTGKIDVVLDGRKVGEGVRRANARHEGDESIRHGVTRAPARLQF